MYSSIFHYLYGHTEEEEIVPDEKTIHQRHLLMRQIINSKMKLKPIRPTKRVTFADAKKAYFKKRHA
jgi:hypothetical protein